MQIETLREFVTLANTLNYRIAAEQLFITQPTLSKHMKELELQVGTRLLDRDTKQVTITRDGAEFLKRAQQICELYDEAILATHHDETEQVRLGVPLGYTFYLNLARAFVERMARQAPSVRVLVEDIGLSGEPAEFLDRGCDIVLAYDPERNSGGDLSSATLCEMRLSLWIAQSNPLAQRSSVSLTELNGMVYRPSSGDPNYPWRKTASAIFDDFGIRPIIGEAADALYQLGPEDFALIFGGEPGGSLGLGVVQLALDEEIPVKISATWRKSRETPFLEETISLLGEEAVELALEHEDIC